VSQVKVSRWTGQREEEVKTLPRSLELICHMYEEKNFLSKIDAVLKKKNEGQYREDERLKITTSRTRKARNGGRN